MNEIADREPLIWIEFEINDFERFQEVVHDWHLDFNQLDGGSFHSKLEQIVLPEIQIGHTHFDCHLDQKGFSPPNMWTFVVMDEASSMINFHHEMTQSTSTMLIYSPGQEINATTYSGFHIYTLSVEQNHLKKIAEVLGLEQIEERLFEIDRVELTSKQAHELREQLKSILTYVRAMDKKIVTTQGVAFFKEYLPIKFLKELHIHAGCAAKKIFKKKHAVFMEARAYIHTFSHTPITVESLVQNFNISERTLRNYFQEELHVSPKQYLTIIRLQKVKAKIQHNSKEITIEAIARSEGFNHMGQFANSYKVLFDELPSETLQLSK